MRKTITTAIIAIAGITGLATPALASGPSVAGSFTVADNGQGCWSGGALLSDGTATGAGACSFSTPLGHENLVFTGKTWSGDATTGVTLCATVRPANAGSDPLGIAPDLGCIGPLPVNAGPVKITGPDGDTTLVRVSLRG